MANYHGLLPEQSEAIVDQRGIITRKFRDFLADLATTTSDAALQAQITALDERVAELEAGGGGLATLVNGTGIQIVGQITDPTIRISLSAYLADLLDVSEAAPADRDRLTWNATTELWEPAVILNPDLAAADTDGLAEGAVNKYFHDAPSDGTPYARQDAGWVAAGSSGNLDGGDATTIYGAVSPIDGGGA